MDPEISVTHPNRELTVNKTDWDWVLLRRALFEQARYHEAKENQERSAACYGLCGEIEPEQTKATYTLERWQILAEEVADYSDHLRYGFSESLADVYVNYVEEVESLINAEDSL